MKPGQFLQKLDTAQVVRAIQEAERKTSGEIRVFVTNRNLGDDKAVDRAAARFEKLGMTSTRDRNAVLLYFAPRAQQFAVVGDTGIHQKCGDAFWRDVASGIREKLGEGRFTEAVVEAIARAGEVLALHFPRRPDDLNELPNEVERE
ncbi:MAG TPA: TPM domain-containing protein [Terrimicrobiaceae bacterium]